MKFEPHKLEKASLSGPCVIWREVERTNSTVDGSRANKRFWNELDFEQATARTKSTLGLFIAGPNAPYDLHLRVPHPEESFHRVRCDWEVGTVLTIPGVGERVVTSVDVVRIKDVTREDAFASGIVECDIPPDEEGPWRIGYMLGPDDGVSGLTVEPQGALQEMFKSTLSPGAYERNAWLWRVGIGPKGEANA